MSSSKEYSNATINPFKGYSKAPNNRFKLTDKDIEMYYDKAIECLIGGYCINSNNKENYNINSPASSINQQDQNKIDVLNIVNNYLINN